ncbi:HSF-type DNA-binding domain containing protein [Ceratobasidium theobromae]|uniref:HSF-type DNA-binding domain containing protein n=1 Tax=Ceratobasidium theobromae TaxID=1582974 RepID=A0A5N5QS54_9AGAM|nr:HSF-type DNA-binding domain containing protein [Ceratobasidium theobromae]
MALPDIDPTIMSRPHHQHSRSFPHNTHLRIPSVAPPTLNIIAPRSPGPTLAIPDDTPPASALSPLSPPSPAPQLRARTPNLSLDITGLTVASGPNSASVSSAQASPLMSAATLVFNGHTMLHPNYLNAPQAQSQSPIQSPAFSFELPSGHSRKRSVSGEPRNESPTRSAHTSADQYDILALLDGSYMPVNGVSPGATGSGSPTTTSDPEPDVDMDGDFKDIDMGNGVFGGPSPGTSSAKPSNNNFVTKLFQMINDTKSANFIAWNEHGTSFIVQSVGEFSRSILGSHFKHSNFSSFVRQLNMYGFHKVNKTPRSQRTSQDNQTWEFSHPKFLKGRVDLLDQIKRKALDNEPPGRNTRVELPAEVATQLRRMVAEHQSLKHALAEERARVEGLTDVVKMLYDIVAATHPVPGQFPNDLLDPTENPPIYITSPPQSPLPPPFQLPNGPFAYSPTSSPTSSDFPQTQDGRGHVKRLRVDDQSFGTAALSLEQHHHALNPVHPHPQHAQTHPAPSDGSRRLLRARSDSAPHGMGLGHYLASGMPQPGRPRSGSSLPYPQQVQPQPHGVKDEYTLGMALGLDM